MGFVRNRVQIRNALIRFCQHITPCLVLTLGVSLNAGAQATTESAGATSATSSAGVSAGQVKPFQTIALPTTAQEQGKSLHLPAGTGPGQEANRQALEQHAGQDAAKLLLRSVPVGARVWIDGQSVGNTPLLLILAPGKYKVEMHGERLEFGERKVDLLPRETRELVLPLRVRYPTQVRIR